VPKNALCRPCAEYADYGACYNVGNKMDSGKNARERNEKSEEAANVSASLAKEEEAGGGKGECKRCVPGGERGHEKIAGDRNKGLYVRKNKERAGAIDSEPQTKRNQIRERGCNEKPGNEKCSFRQGTSFSANKEKAD